MAEVNTDDGGGSGKHGKKRAKKSSTRIDMTPMVDLAFLLLTFFVLTSTFSKPKAMELTFPVDPEKKENQIKVKNAITFIMTKDDGLYYYNGEFYPPNNKDGMPPTTLSKTNFSKDGLHKLLLERYEPTLKEIHELEDKYKRKEIAADSTFKRMLNEVKGHKDALTVLIKADDQATYKNVVDLIDELNVCLVGKYAVVDMMPTELELLNAENTK
ncbi:MAG: biopolymer transporter ExbD [Bacteroidia bacterium]